jgi:hypothetical protein
VEVAETDDDVAADILKCAAHDLTEMVLAAWDQLALPRAFPLAATGGVLVHHDLVRKLVVEELKRTGVQPALHLVAEPVRGAVELARRLVSPYDDQHAQ